jgi:hypothetical protein
MAEALGAIISMVLRHHAKQYGPLLAIQRDWAKLAGELLAAHTKPVSLRRGRLVIHVDAPADSFALNYERPQLLKRLQAKTKGQVQELVIRVGEL